VHPERAPGEPAPLRAAPPQASTPLPGTFTLSESQSTQNVDGGAVLLGGSPTRLFRISARGQRLLARWRSGGAVGESRAAQLLARRLVAAGVFVPQPAKAGFGRGDVTVVVPVRDRPAQLDRLLRSLGDLDCIVVDDASSDAGAIKEIAERHGARFIGLTTHCGPAGARNAGMTLVERAVVAFVDSDCVARAGWLETLLGHFDDPVVGAVAPRVVPADAGANSVVQRYEARRSSLDLGPNEGPVRPGSPIPYVPSAALLVRADVVTGTDLFDPALWGGEDVDLVWRLVDAGWDVRYVPSSIVEHDGTASLVSFLARRTFYGSTAGPLALRHPEAMAPIHVSAWSLGVWLLALARRPVLALATLAASVTILADRLRGLVRDPVAVASRIAGGGTVRSALPALSGAARTWSPALLLGLLSRRTRRAAALTLVVPALRDWATDRGTLDPLRYVALHVADDAAYASGVWVGSARSRTLVPLLPRVSWRSRVWSSEALRQGLDEGRGGPTGTSS
jgi:mycofactocin system glycosyltransferase